MEDFLHPMTVGQKAREWSALKMISMIFMKIQAQEKNFLGLDVNILL